MKYSIEKTEHYALLHLEANDNLAESISALGNLLNQLLKEYEFIYFILDLNSFSELPQEMLEPIQSFHEQLLNKNGLAISIHEGAESMQMFEQADLLLVPTENEAVEYVFMDQLEKQFLTDELD